MKDGKVEANRAVNTDLTTKKSSTYMLGRSFEKIPQDTTMIGYTMLEALGLSDEAGRVKNVSFSIKGGEIVGICGLVGAGKTELCKLLFGANKMRTGQVKLRGRSLRIRTPTSAVRQKIALVPEERRKEGVLVTEPVYFNLSAACLGKFCNRLSFVKKNLEIKNAKQLVAERA